MPKPTIKRVLNEAQDPHSSFELVKKDLFRGDSNRPTQHFIRVTEESSRKKKEAIKTLKNAASNSKYTFEEDLEYEDVFILKSQE